LFCFLSSVSPPSILNAVVKTIAPHCMTW
jgi:hypothetical protein